MCYCNPCIKTPCCRSSKCIELCKQKHSDKNDCTKCLSETPNKAIFCDLCNTNNASYNVNVWNKERAKDEVFSLCFPCYKQDQKMSTI